ncbi:MAG TPA: tetratricopeptide repeat protein [Phycisphaerales bacterium]|nr:tetratricopeptide repeat protein [Phycisphaerales bacterium]
MASKVNTKFVVGLTVGVLVVCGGVVGVAAYLLNNTATDNVRTGDKFASAGDYTQAAEQYSKAVNKEKTNTAYLSKWVDALSKSNAETQTNYEKLYTDWTNAQRQLAIVDAGNVTAQRAYMDLQRRLVEASPFSAESYSFLAGEADTFIRLHEASGPGAWEVLKRYRGIANVSLYFNAPNPKEDQLTQAVKDLKAALKADPKDSESAVALADIALRKAAKAYEALNRDEAAALERESDDTLSAFLAANPDHPDVLLSLIQRDVIRTQRRLMESAGKGDPEKESKDFTERSIPILDRAVASAKKMPGPLDEDLLTKFRNVENMVVGAALPRTEELTRDSLRARPDSPQLLGFLADILTARNDTAGAIEQYDKISKLPTPPISIEGRMLFDMRKGALAQQAYLAARGALAKDAGADREASIAMAKGLRTKLAELESADSIRLLLVDATLAVLEGTSEGNVRAGQLLDQYNRKTDKKNPEAVQLAALIALRQNQIGAARDLFETVVRLQPTNIGAILSLANAHANLQEYTPALNYYRQVLRLDPTNATAKEGADLMAAFTGQGSSSDPVVNVILQAEAVRRSGVTTENIKKILQILSDGYAKHKDPRLAIAYANSLAGDSQKELALKVLDEMIAANPDNESLKERRRMLATDDPAAEIFKNIDKTAAPEVDKHLQKFSLLVAQGKEQEAIAELDLAAKAAPEDARVVELQFLRALEAGKMDEAKALSDKAARSNADSQGGDTYRARFLAQQGDVKQAITILQGCVSRGGAQPEVYRLLGRTLARDGRRADAAQAFRDSLRLRPTDVPTAVDLLDVLVQSGNMTEALSVAREFQRYGEADVRFLPVWLEIEAAVGDREMAVTRREQMMRTRPDDRGNLMALADLYIQANKYDKARPLIDKVRAKQDGLDAVVIDAVWQWNQRKQDEARKIFTDFLAKTDAAQRSGVVGTYAGFLLDRGDVAGATAQLEGARAGQDPKRMEVDRALSDLYTRLGKATEALEAARRVTGANADTADRLYQKRAVELLTMSGKYDEAQAELTKLTTGREPDAVTLLLAAQLAGAQKKSSAEVDALNQAVAKFSTNPTVFLRRAEFFMKDAKTFRDAEADLTRAIELAPQESTFHQRRAQLRMQMENESGALADMRDAVRLAPGDNDLLFGTLTQLFRLGKDQEMNELASEAARQRARDPGLQLALGQFYQKLPVKPGDVSGMARNMGLIRQYFEAAYRIDNSEYNALTYAGALLANPGADPAAAEKVVDEAGAAAKASPGYQMTLARIRMMQGRKPDALRIAQDALRLANPESPAHMNAWISDLARMLPDVKERIQYLDNTGRAGIAPDWMLYYRSADMINDPATRADGLAGMKRTAESAKLPALREASTFELGRAHLLLGSYEEAVNVWKAGIAAFPNNAEMHNNAAYVLAENLKRPQDALPIAERAAELAPASPDVQDTLGTVLLMTGKAKEAVPHFERALQRSTDPRSALTIAIHLADACIQSENYESAKTALSSIDALQQRTPGLFTEEITKQVQELRTRLEGK